MYDEGSVGKCRRRCAVLHYTYKYNAETSTSLARATTWHFARSLFSVSATTTEHSTIDKDATRYYKAFDQLSVSLSAFDTGWANDNGSPQFAYYYDTPSVATVNQTTGLGLIPVNYFVLHTKMAVFWALLRFRCKPTCCFQVKKDETHASTIWCPFSRCFVRCS